MQDVTRKLKIILTLGALPLCQQARDTNGEKA